MAEQGYAIAQHNLGYCFEHGQGVRVDYPEAYKWYQLAAKQGIAQSEHAMEALGAIMTPKQLLDSQSRVLTWLQKNRLPEFNRDSMDVIGQSKLTTNR